MSAGSPLSESIDNLVYEPLQVHEHGVDLTVSAIYAVDGPGSLDFGGDELEDAELEPVPTSLRHPEDEFGWWHLDGGQYVVQYNEFLTDLDDPAWIQPRNELLARGASHPSVRVFSHLPLMPIQVADGGIEIKENARISTLIVTDTA